MEKPISLLDEGKIFNIDRAGLFTVYVNKTNSFSYYLVPNQSYCMEHAFKNGISYGYKIFSRLTTAELEVKFVVTRWIKILSCICLLLTILIYIILKKMRNLFAKILMSYCVATFLTFFFLTFSQFYYNDFDDAVCKLMGYLSILASICSFTWLNVISIDIWFSFGSPRTMSGPLQRNELKRLLQYSLYGWGFPLVWILLIYVFNTTEILPEALQPYVGINKCYLENSAARPGNYSYNFFLTLPMLIQQVINIFLFVKTITYTLKIKAEIQRMNDTKASKNYKAGKDNLNLVLKLGVIMGVSFLFETVSSFYDFNRTFLTRYIEVVGDTINCLQGVFIFIIFICKKKMYNDILQKFNIHKFSKQSGSSRHSIETTTETISMN